MLQKASIRALSLILAALMLLSLCACGAREPENPPATTVPLPEPMPDKEGPQEEPPQTPEAEDSKGDKIQDEKGVSEADPNAGGESAPSDKTGGGESAPPAAGDMQALQREVEQHSKVYNNGDNVYTPSIEKLTFDQDANELFFSNSLTIYLLKELSKEEQDTLAFSVGGIVSGHVSGMNILQIAVPDSDLATLAEKSDLLMENEDVLYATYLYPVEIDNSEIKNPSNAPWADSEDWWTDAIEVHSAWDYYDFGTQVAVGVIDEGFDEEHEDLQYNGSSVLHVLGDNTVSDHGTHVVGLIAAQDNSMGIRGVADHALILCGDWSMNVDGQEEVCFLTPVIINAFTSQMVSFASERNIPIVINNSWNIVVPSKFKYTNMVYEEVNKDEVDGLKFWLKNLYEYYCIHITGAYESFLSYLEVHAQRTAMESMIGLVQLLQDDQNNFIIVESAGNGLDGDMQGIDSKSTGWYCAIDEELYNNTYSEATRSILSKKGITYDTVKEHIIIVGAVAPMNSNGLYPLTDFSNFGDTVDICAPGQDIYSTIPTDENGYRYAMDSGTSMAAPLVTGSAALLWSLDPTLSAGKVKEYLKDPDRAVGVTGEDKGRLYPMLNVGRAVEKVVGLQYEEAASFSDAIRSCMQRIGYDSFSDTQKALCRGELFTFKGEEMLLLYYEVPAGTRVERSSYVDLWVKRDGQIRCLMNSRIENSEDRNLTLCNACIRIREGECMLHTYVRAVGGEDISQSCYYLIDDTFSLAYELYSKETAVYGQDGLLNPDESSGYYSVNMQETDRDSFYRLQDELNSGTNAVEMITLDPRSHEGIPPQGKTFEELLKQLQGDKDSAPGDGTARGDEDPIPGGGGIPDMEEIKEALLVHYAYPPERNRYAIFDFDTVEKDQTIEFTLRRQSDGGDYYTFQTLITVNKETGMASSLYNDEPWPVWDPATGKVYREIADFTVLSELHIPISEEDCYVILKNYFGLQMDPEKTRFDTSYVDPGNGDPYYYIEIFDPVFNGIGELYGPGVCDRWCIIYVNTGLAEEGAPTGAGSCTFDAVIYYY